MRSSHAWRLASALFLCGGLFATNQLAGAHSPVAHAAGTAVKTTFSQVGTVTFPTGGTITGVRPGLAPSGLDGGNDGGTDYPININRPLGPSKGTGRTGVGASKAKSNPSEVQSFNGLSSYDQATAAPGGNFILEPPDQGLCAGNGYVVDGVNDAMSVYSQATGKRIAGPTTLNSFLGFAPQFDGTTYGPEPTDPSCYYDSDTGRFFFSILTLNVSSDGSWDGSNELDLAVSNSNNPTGSWTVYRTDVTGDGASGCPCLGDYPHIGADANGIYLTTNDFPLTTDGFNGSQVYAYSKQALESGTANVNGWRFDTSQAPYTVNGGEGFTVWPATAPAGKYETGANGTEYFLSSTYDVTEDSNIAVWALTNTKNLSGANPPTLSNTTVSVYPYADPPNATQKAGPNFPLGQLEGETSEGPIASNDSRNLSAVFANGKLWGALTTGVVVNGVNEAGIAYYIINPDVSNGTLTAKLALQGTLAEANGNVIFPSIGVTPSGRGVMTYTLTGPNDFPSAAYSSLDAKAGAGPITIANGGAGVGPQDGFTEYGNVFGDDPRWGDYGAASVDGNNIWIASEYIGQQCDVNTYLADYPYDTCGGTRTWASNWGTRITELNLHP
jgi:hypothetical protein